MRNGAQAVAAAVLLGVVDFGQIGLDSAGIERRQLRDRTRTVDLSHQPQNSIAAAIGGKRRNAGQRVAVLRFHRRGGNGPVDKRECLDVVLPPGEIESVIPVDRSAPDTFYRGGQFLYDLIVVRLCTVVVVSSHAVAIHQIDGPSFPGSDQEVRVRSGGRVGQKHSAA